MIVDAHHHLWDPARGDYGWLEPGSVLDRTWTADDFAPLLAAAGVEGTILVQAAPTLAETDWLLDIRRRTSWVLGVVGWVDLDALDIAETIACRVPLGLVGVRPMLQDLPDPEWILAPERRAAIGAIARAGLVFDALVRPAGLGAIVALADRHPGLSIVIDHCAKPPLAQPAAMARWRAAIHAAASRPNIRCKLSGLVTESPAGPDDPAIDRMIAEAIATWGPARLLWGSDWPVLTTTGSYHQWIGRVRAHLAGLTQQERAAVFGLNAIATYRPASRSARA